MSIKTRLNIILFLSVITIVGLYAYIVKITLDIDNEIEQLQKVEEFGENVSQLGLITEYYLTHHEERYIEAWVTLINKIETLSIEVDDFRRYHIVRESSPAIRNAFELIVRINREPEIYSDPEMRSEILERASTRIRSDVRQLMTISYVVSENRLDNIRSLQVDQRLYYLLILVPVILALLIIAYFMRRLIINSINQLQEGTARFASGKLDERIELHGNDELSELAVHFNSMAEELENLVEREKLLNNKLELQTAELKKSNEELESFASIASHDLKEPLRMIRNFMELLQKKYHDQLDETAQKYINFAVDGSERMTNLINDLLEFSRVGKTYTEFKKVNVQQILDEILQHYGPRIEESNAVVKQDSMPEINAIQVSLKIVFQNLISNALKYHKGKVKPKIEILSKELDTHWQFSISDNGIGIEEEYRERIFQLFNRLHSSEEYPGTGMGLATCRKIVEQHGGEIWVESEPGKGSTFHFTIAKKLAE